MGGIGGEISARISEHAFEHLDGPVRRLAAPDVHAVALNEKLEAHFLIDQQQTAEAVRELAACWRYARHNGGVSWS